MKRIKFLVLGLILSIGSSVDAQIEPVDANGLAIGGYDVVAYFSGVAKRGFESYSTKHNGATYYFSSEENKEAFKKSPKKYLPQYDGYCAWGVAAQNTKFPINPETFDVVDGKLYLFFNGPFKGNIFDTSIPWNAETTSLIAAGKKNWPKVKKS
ncbi:YHS domain-containing protein [Flavobacteriaceae bacterium R38]|nr:YHS domain-containing protein [Flavobacteriaceae bacterium R38]